MLAHLSLITALLASLALASPAPVEADDRHHRGTVITIGHPSVEIYAPPVSIHFGPRPIYRPYYYYPPRYYYPPPHHHYYGPRYYPRHHHHRPYGRPYHRDYHYRDYRHRR